MVLGGRITLATTTSNETTRRTTTIMLGKEFPKPLLHSTTAVSAKTITLQEHQTNLTTNYHE
jgi:hypothetical protein